jgi:hypothetical protein
MDEGPRKKRQALLDDIARVVGSCQFNRSPSTEISLNAPDMRPTK